MIITDVTDELAAAVDAIEGLRVYAYPPGKVAPPAAVVSLPDTIEYGQSYQHGQATLTVIVHVLVGMANLKAARNAISEFASTAGPRSVRTAIEGHEFTAADSATVNSAEFTTITFAGVDLLAASFTVTVIGSGS